MKKITLNSISKEHNIDYQILWERINTLGWSLYKAVKTPIRAKRETTRTITYKLNK